MSLKERPSTENVGALWKSTEDIPQGLKPELILCLCGTTEQVAEKGLITDEESEKCTSGAKAHVDLIGVLPGINLRPTARMSFSAAYEVVPFQSN